MNKLEHRRWAQPLAVLLVTLQALGLSGATLTVQTNRIGTTPDILGYNAGHFFPGSNTRAWWRYAGVNGARIFLSPSAIEPADDLPPVGDGVNSLAGFLERRAAIRTNQFNPAYINWTVFTNNYEETDLAGNNHIKANFALGELRQLNVQVLAQLTASQSRLPIAGADDWPNMWELWQHYYAQAFYLGRSFEVQRYQMFNEPNHSSAGGLTQTNFLLRLQLASDAIQTALADVNSLYGKALVPKVLAPVTAGTADRYYTGWGDLVVTNRHWNWLGQRDPNFSLIQVYDYHQYNSLPAVFGSDLASLNARLSVDMYPEARFPTSISEFNTHTGATFDTLAATLDSATEYPRLAAVAVNLIANECRELYCFKFSQTLYTGNYPVQKNALHYVDNQNAPYNVGGITKAGEVWRLLNKAFAPGRSRLSVARGSGATSLDVQAGFDPSSQRYYLFAANNTASDVSLSLNLSAWNIPTNNATLVEEVSESCYGAGRLWTNVGLDRTVSGILGSNSVWLLSVAAAAQQPEQLFPATDAAEVRDGTNQTRNFSTNAVLTVQNDPVDPAQRCAAFLKFSLPTTNLADLQFALLSVTTASTTNAPVQAHVYGILSNQWSQNTITWSNAPNLRKGVPAGSRIAQNVIEGLGSSALVLGQLVASATNFAERWIEVSDFIRSQTNGQASFLLSQDPRWDVTLPSLAPGDVPPGGLRLVSLAGASPSAPGPRLRLVFNQSPGRSSKARGLTANLDRSVTIDFSGQPGQNYLVQAATNLSVNAWATIGTNVADPDGLWSFTDAHAVDYPARFYRSALSGTN